MSKYVGLWNEYQRMWNKKVKVVPEIGAVEKNLKKHLNRLPGKHNIHNL